MSKLPALLLSGLVATIAFAATASADSRFRERVHADSFGNLVIYSPAGYKRIVVDKGYLAEELAAYGRPADAGETYDPAPYATRAPCRRLPAQVRGRSFLYGLPEGVVPIISVCE